ncbi:transposase [Streptomyces virginiae]
MDEFALRKGHVYATILVDIETRRPVDLLPERSVETVARWLADHPGVQVICRDRSASHTEPDDSAPLTRSSWRTNGTSGRTSQKELRRQASTTGHCWLNHPRQPSATRHSQQTTRCPRRM